jgi:hypothetical protein
LLVRREIDSSASPLSSDELTQIDAWRRAANYLFGRPNLPVALLA